MSHNVYAVRAHTTCALPAFDVLTWFVCALFKHATWANLVIKGVWNLFCGPAIWAHDEGHLVSKVAVVEGDAHMVVVITPYLRVIYIDLGSIPQCFNVGQHHISPVSTIVDS